MRWFPALITALGAAGIAAALVIPGLSDALLIAIPVAISGAILLVGRPSHVGLATPTQPAKQPERQLVLDGSNIMFWRDNRPDLATVSSVIEMLTSKGYRVGVVFDASAGHILFGRYLDDRHFATRLGLPENMCFVVPKGSIADEYILRAARMQGARVVTNDRYRDWARDFPEVAKPGFLIRGRIEKGQVLLHRLTPPRRRSAGFTKPTARRQPR